MTDMLLGVRVERALPDLQIEKPIVDRPLPGGLRHLAADREQAILSVTGVGTFAVERGNRIRFWPAADVPDGAVSVWLQGSVTALLLAQRRCFALHASVVDIDGQGVAVAGLSRSGKSTTALRLRQFGHPLVSDDVSPLVTGGPITVHPYMRPIHVLPETAAMLGLDVSEGRPILPGYPKLALVSESRQAVPLGLIAVLETSDDGIAVETARAHGARAQWLVGMNIYRASRLRELWPTEMFFWAADVAENVPVYMITRPGKAWTVDLVARKLERLVRDLRISARTGAQQ
jgi:hypothetical protein